MNKRQFTRIAEELARQGYNVGETIKDPSTKSWAAEIRMECPVALLGVRLVFKGWVRDHDEYVNMYGTYYTSSETLGLRPTEVTRVGTRWNRADKDTEWTITEHR